MRYTLAHQWHATGEIRFVSNILYETKEAAQIQADTLNAVERGEQKHWSVARLHSRADGRDSGWRWIVQEIDDDRTN